MTRFIPRWLGAAAVLSAVVLSAVPARALDMDTIGGVGHRKKLDTICSEGLARFCPALADRPGQTLSQVICLKPYRSSLSLPCRRAVTAAMK